MRSETRQTSQINQLIDRLGRLSADSYWAHQASGVRGSLLRCLEQMQDRNGPITDPVDSNCSGQLEQLVALGYLILERAARQLERIR